MYFLLGDHVWCLHHAADDLFAVIPIFIDRRFMLLCIHHSHLHLQYIPRMICCISFPPHDFLHDIPSCSSISSYCFIAFLLYNLSGLDSRFVFVLFLFCWLEEAGTLLSSCLGYLITLLAVWLMLCYVFNCCWARTIMSRN